MTRFQTLQNRYDRLLEANQKYQYVYSDKVERYLNTLRKIKSEMTQLQRKHDTTLNKSNYKFTLSKEHIFNLTNPL